MCYRYTNKAESSWKDSNLRHPGPKPGALTTELQLDDQGTNTRARDLDITLRLHGLQVLHGHLLRSR